MPSRVVASHSPASQCELRGSRWAREKEETTQTVGYEAVAVARIKQEQELTARVKAMRGAECI